ncbi:hydroxymethylglutaryl-CoA lyase [Pseudomonas fulva]|uniref:hydroxymethylglutaryl-CoA lyase n=1 Tax=Pseudomonas fulva TaxID=47880 RepID=UPI003CF16EDB
MPDVTLCECFARDGLQHEPQFLETGVKTRLIERFAELGFSRLEATSYSNPAVVPQFADASALLAGLGRKEGVFYKATCANVRAVERALADLEAGFGANEISLLVSASQSHSQRNLKRSREDQWANIAAMADAAQGRFRLIGTISVAFGCPFEGRVDEAQVLRDVEAFARLGVQHVTLGDTTGVATPHSVRRLFGQVRQALPEITSIAHFHDTRATGLANYIAALEADVHWFDCAFGGVGGHPAKVTYGGGHTGNVSTEDWVNLLESMGVSTGIDLEKLLEVAAECEQALGRALHSRVLRSGLNPLIAS